MVSNPNNSIDTLHDDINIFQQQQPSQVEKEEEEKDEKNKK